MSEKTETSGQILSPKSARLLCEASNTNSEFFDEGNDEYIAMRDYDPEMLIAVEELFTLANCEDDR